MKYRSVLYFISLSLAFVMLASSCGRKAAPADGTTASGGADETASVTSADTEASGATLPAAQPAEPAEETEPPAPAAPASPWDGYTIVRSDLASDDVIQTVIALRKALLEKGIDIPLATDFVGWNETAPESGKEILVGATTRAASEPAMADLRLGDWRVGYDGSTGFVTVAGGSVPALADACSWLAANAADGPEALEGYEFKAVYPLDDFTVLGYRLSDYTLVGDPQAIKAQKLMAKLAAENCGYGVAIDNSKKNGPIITFLTDDKIDGYRIETKGGMMAIYGSDQTQLYAAVADLFAAAMNGRNSVGLDYVREGKAELTPVTLRADSAETLAEAVNKAKETASGGLYAITIALDNNESNEISVDAPLILDGDDFGVSSLTFDGSSGVVLSGGFRLSGSDFYPAELNGAACQAADIPEGVPLPRDVFISYGGGNAAGAQRLTPAEFPGDGGYYHVSGIPGEISLSDFGTFEGSGTFSFREDIPALSDPASAQMVMYHYWEQERFGIKEIDNSSKVLSLNGVTSMNLMSGGSGPAVFRLENVREALDQPGEFYVDRSNRKLYLIPENGTMDGSFVWLAASEQAMIIKNMASLTFRNVSFSGFGWDMENRNPSQGGSDLPGVIEITDSLNVTFHACDFSHLSYYAIKAVKGVSGLTAANCVFRDIGSGAVHLGGENTDTGCISDCLITRNVISGYGRDFADGIGVLARYVRNCEISHNDISDGYYTGISCGWTWGYGETVTDGNTISYNLIHDIGKGVLSDLGGIYTLGTQTRTRLRGNVIYNVSCRDYGGWGIYLDEGSTGITVTENLCYDLSSNAFHQHYGRDNMIYNNIFAFGGNSCIAVTRKEDHVSFYLERNILIQNGADIYNHAPHEMNFMDRSNLIWDYAREPMTGNYTVGMMVTGGYCIGSIVADPLLADPAGRNFTLTPESPAYRIGFEPFDTTLAGING